MGSIGSSKTILVTGATGHVGSVIIELAIKDGYQVRGLSRTEKGDEKLKGLGAHPVRGDLHSLSVLRDEAAHADVVIHLADSFLDQSNPKQYEEAIQIDGAAVDALAEPMKGTDKPLIVTSGTLVVAPNNGKETDEDSPVDPKPFVERIRSERHAMSWADKGVKVICIRLAPYVYGRGRSGVFLFLAGTIKSKQAIYIGDGHWQTSTVHVDDAARLYLLAAQKAKRGDIFNATSQTDLTAKQIAEAMAAECDVPAVSITEEQATAAMGSFLPKFLTAECRASSAKAQRNLGWEPKELALLDELSHGSYHHAVQGMKKSSS